MNRIEKAEWVAGPRRRDAREQAGAAGQLSGPPLCPGLGALQPPPRGAGHRAAPRPGHSAPSGLPFICWLCHFLSIADPFSVPSVISNNVTASLESIHQSRKKPMLTLIKKKYHLCLTGKSSQPNLWRPRRPHHPPACHFTGCPGVIRFHWGRDALPQVAPPLPLSLSRAKGRRALKEVSTPRGFPSAEEFHLAIWVFFF